MSDRIRVPEITDDWIPLPRFRWLRPAGGSDPDRKLQQLWEHQYAHEAEWRDVEVVLED